MRAEDADAAEKHERDGKAESEISKIVRRRLEEKKGDLKAFRKRLALARRFGGDRISFDQWFELVCDGSPEADQGILVAMGEANMLKIQRLKMRGQKPDSNAVQWYIAVFEALLPDEKAALARWHPELFVFDPVLDRWVKSRPDSS